VLLGSMIGASMEIELARQEWTTSLRRVERAAADRPAYEQRQRLQLWTFGSDGLLTQCEWFDPERGAEALARFDDFSALAASPAPARQPVGARA